MLNTLELEPVTIVVHGADRSGDAAFMDLLRATTVPVGQIHFVPDETALAAVRNIMEHRGDRYLALVDARCTLEPLWLDALMRRIRSVPSFSAVSGTYCTLLHLAKYPQHHRLEDAPSLDAALQAFLEQGLAYRAVPEALKHDAQALERAFRQSPRRRPGLVSIVMLSWNAPQFTKLALESIREHTTGEYEVIIVDNGSEPDTVAWLRTLTGVRVIYNDHNKGFAGGNNQAIAAARGEYIVLLNNDVIVTAGWLDGLLRPFERIPALGVSAPRSNKIAGNQIVADASYADMEQMHAYAAARSERYRDRGYATDRAIGLCLCIDRRTIEEVGGIDERFGVGNFEDDDFCLRVRAAGYRIFVCDDVFIHHFGSQTFAANKVDWTATMRENWNKFAAKWGLVREPNGGYIPGPAIRRGFVRERHYVPLPAAAADTPRSYDVAFTACVQTEEEWNDVSAFVRRYSSAFEAERPLLLAIAATGALDAATLGRRIERFAKREGVDLNTVADIEVSDEPDASAWFATLPAARVAHIADISDPSPSGLRRFVQTVNA